MKEKKLIPKRRFKEFINDEAWEQRKLGEVAEIVRGASPRPIQDPKWFDKQSDVGWLRISDVTEQDGRIYHLEQHISELGQDKTRVLTEPHLLLSIAATVGKPVINYIKTGVHDGFLIFLRAKFDREFMFQWLEMFRPMWQKYGQPGSQVNLNSDLVKNQEVFLPSYKEQEKIGAFFEQLDNLITLHQRKLNKLKETKSAYLSEMFPKEGEKYPKRRFAGFTDPWKQLKLGDLGNIVTGSTPPTSEITNYGGNYLFVSPADIQENRYIENTITKLSEEGFEKGRVLKEGSTLFVSIGSTIGKVAQTKGLATTNQQINSIEPTEEYDNDFIYSMMKYKAGVIKLLAATQAVPILNKTSFSQVEVTVPLNIKEQIQIGNFFKDLDNLITLHQRKLEKLENLKKAYLNEMFV